MKPLCEVSEENRDLLPDEDTMKPLYDVSQEKRDVFRYYVTMKPSCGCLYV